MKKYDIIIVGGGPAGAAACLTLATYTKLKVALIDAGNPRTDFRVGETTSPALKPLLKYLGALEKFEASNHAPCQSFYAAWGSPQLLERHSLFSGRGTGWHIDRYLFDTSLHELAAEKGADIYTDTQVLHFAEKGKQWILTTSKSGENLTLEADFVIDASGRKGVLAKHLHLSYQVVDRLAAYMMIFKTHTPLQGGVVMETTPDGWWYTSKLPNQHLLVTFMTDVDIAKKEGYNELATWGEKVCYTNHVYHALTKVSPESNLIIRPAHTKYLAQSSGENWIMAGEANMSFDPLSSMGIGYALSSGIQAARIAVEIQKGNTEVANTYHIDSQRQFSEYLTFYQQFYSLEKRWQHLPFWSRRNTSTAETNLSHQALVAK